MTDHAKRQQAYQNSFKHEDFAIIAKFIIVIFILACIGGYVEYEIQMRTSVYAVGIRN